MCNGSRLKALSLQSAGEGLSRELIRPNKVTLHDQLDDSAAFLALDKSLGLAGDFSTLERSKSNPLPRPFVPGGGNSIGVVPGETAVGACSSAMATLKCSSSLRCSWWSTAVSGFGSTPLLSGSASTARMAASRAMSSCSSPWRQPGVVKGGGGAKLRFGLEL